MANKKQFPREGIPRSVARPRQSKKTREKYGKGFNSRGLPITCGYITPWGGQCGAYVEDLGLCEFHREQDRERRKNETLEDRRREWREGEERAARSFARLRPDFAGPIAQAEKGADGE
ncbi:MAG TPA: hypothetical protein VIT63_04525 [Nitrospira sp.]